MEPSKYPWIRNIAQVAMAHARLEFTTLSDVVAVIFKESMGVPWFCKCNLLYRDNTAALVHGADITEEQWLKVITVPDGASKGKIPKFRYEPGYHQAAVSALGKLKCSYPEALIFACSFGLGQKMMRYLVAGKPETEWLTLARKFMQDPLWQAEQAVSDLEYVLKASHGNRPLAYSRYNAGVGSTHVTQYGTDVWKIYQELTGQTRAVS